MRVLCIVLALIAACAKAEEHWYLSDEPHEPEAHWSYEGETGPKHWGDLSPAYLIARIGLRRSPIDVRTDKTASSPDIQKAEIHYATESASFVNNGHTLQHDELTESWMSVGGKRYDLRQFHFHTPSEHTLDGRRFPAPARRRRWRPSPWRVRDHARRWASGSDR